ncbi:MAG: (2Fe-2S)-binding protein [Chloroflexi bacterium]|nr:(2Fe-2S)-binding protein [Chloroflexota bacterium]
MAKKRIVTLKVNGVEYQGLAEPRKLLVDFIREDCGLTGTHVGCEHGVCGACTILIDGEPVRSCILVAVQGEGHELTTIEGLAKGNELHPVQEAFIAHHGLQCGFCTPGFIMSAVAFLRDTPAPTEQDVREGLSGNLCRCTGYQSIVESVLDAADRLRAPAAPTPAS